MITEADFVEVTTESRRKRHWSLVRDLRPSRVGAGRIGYTLCGGYLSSDQERITDEMPAGWRKRVVIADLSACKQCEKSKARRIAGRRS